MDERDHLGTFFFEERARLGFGEHLSPRLFEADHMRPVAAAHLGDSFAEESVDEDRQFRAGIDEVGNGGFHARASRSGDHQRAGILGSEHRAQAVAHVVKYLIKERIEVSDQRFGHGFINAGFHLRWAGPNRRRRGGLRAGMETRL